MQQEPKNVAILRNVFALIVKKNERKNMTGGLTKAVQGIGIALIFSVIVWLILAVAVIKLYFVKSNYTELHRRVSVLESLIKN